MDLNEIKQEIAAEEAVVAKLTPLARAIKGFVIKAQMAEHASEEVLTHLEHTMFYTHLSRALGHTIDALERMPGLVLDWIHGQSGDAAAADTSSSSEPVTANTDGSSSAAPADTGTDATAPVTTTEPTASEVPMDTTNETAQPEAPAPESASTADAPAPTPEQPAPTPEVQETTDTTAPSADASPETPETPADGAATGA